MFKDFLNWLREVIPLLVAYWSGIVSSLRAQAKTREIENENLKKDIDFADNTSDDDFIKLLNKKNK